MKLAISEPRDAHEREADQVADARCRPGDARDAAAFSRLAKVARDALVMIHESKHRVAVMVGSGLAMRGLLSLWARALRGVGFAMDSLDALSVMAQAMMLTIASAAALLPAARTDPLIALRSD